MTFPDAVTVPGASQKLSMTARATKLPESTFGEIAVPYFGRQEYLYGTRTFEPWDITIMNDTDFAVRNAFLQWHNLMNTMISNRLDPSVANVNPALGASYKSTAIVTQFDQIGPGDIDGPGAIASYTFNGVWPVQITEIPLDWNAGNEIEQFQVRLRYDWYELGVTADGTTLFPLELSDDA